MTRGARGTTALALGSALSGLLAYVVFALTTRALGPAAAAPVSLLWSYWAFAGAAFTFPLQHWITRSIAAHGEGAVSRAVPRVAAAVLAASAVVGAAAWLGREELFHSDGLWFPAMAWAMTLGSAMTGVVRGALSARDRFAGVGASLVAENALRCLAVVALVLADVRDPVAYGLCLVAGHLAMALWPSSFRLGRPDASTHDTRAIRFLAGASLAQVINQGVLTGGPVVLALAGGSEAQITALFAALALFRAPYTLALGLVAQLTGHLTRLVVTGEQAVIRRVLQTVVAGTLGAAAVAAVAGGWIGPQLLRVVFGQDLRFPAAAAAVVATGCALAVANLVLGTLGLAQNRTGAVSMVWVVATAAAAALFVVAASPAPTTRTVLAFLFAEAAGFVGLLAVAARRARTAR